MPVILAAAIAQKTLVIEGPSNCTPEEYQWKMLANNAREHMPKGGLYIIAHGSPWWVRAGCDEPLLLATSLNERRFSYIASCNGLCETRSESFAYELGGTVIGYCGMDEDRCGDCWHDAYLFQNRLFMKINTGTSINMAYGEMIEELPHCSECILISSEN